MTSHQNGTAGICAGEVSHLYFLARTRGESVETLGCPSAAFGHQLRSIMHAAADGIFASWKWDGRRLVVNNDRYGFQPIFWFAPPGGGVCVSASLITLIEKGASTELDIEALAVFFRLGFFVGEDTPFSAIKVVPPNAVFEWENGKLECHGRYPSVSKASGFSRSEAIDRYIDLFAKAMAKRPPGLGTFVIPISGGRDSRHILLELHRTGYRPTTCVSLKDNPPDPNQDFKIAGDLCAELGVTYKVVTQSMPLLQALMRNNLETNFCGGEPAWYFGLADFMNGRFDCAYDGIAGDVLSQSSFLNSDLHGVFLRGNAIEASRAFLARYGTNSSFLRALLQGKLGGAASKDVALGRLSREMTRHLGSPNPIASFVFWNRTRRKIALAPFTLLSKVGTVYAPYLDHALFDFLSQLPAESLLDRSLHTDAIARAYPKYAHIPYADKSAPGSDDSALRTRFQKDLLRKFVFKKPSKLMSNLGPRAKMLLGSASMGRFHPWISPLVVYIDQIESVVGNHRLRNE